MIVKLDIFVIITTLLSNQRIAQQTYEGKNMSLYQLDAPLHNYVFDKNTSKVFSLVAVGRKGQLTEMTKSKSGYKLSIQGNDGRKQIGLSAKRIAMYPMKPYGIGEELTEQATNRLSANAPARYQRLHAPYDGYVLDTMTEDLYSLIRNGGNGSFFKLTPYRATAYKSWMVTVGKNVRKVSLTQIKALIQSGMSTNYTHSDAETEVYWMVLNTGTAQVHTTKFVNVIDASELARVETEATGFEHHILKLVGKSSIDKRARVKRVAA